MELKRQICHRVIVIYFQTSPTAYIDCIPIKNNTSMMYKYGNNNYYYMKDLFKQIPIDITYVYVRGPNLCIEPYTMTDIVLSAIRNKLDNKCDIATNYTPFIYVESESSPPCIIKVQKEYEERARVYLIERFSNDGNPDAYFSDQNSTFIHPDNLNDTDWVLSKIPKDIKHLYIQKLIFKIDWGMFNMPYPDKCGEGIVLSNFEK